MGKIFNFIKSKYFFIHLSLIGFALVVLFFITIKWLSSFTGHNEYVQVPDFTGVNIEKLDQFIGDQPLKTLIIDSIYDPKSKAASVIRQDPLAGTNVKHNRTIYLYVTCMVPPQISMPKLIDRSERQARLIISTYGLKVGKVTEKSADCNGCIISQMVNGTEIEEGAGVPKGTKIDLVVGVKGHYNNASSDSTSTETKLNFDEEE